MSYSVVLRIIDGSFEAGYDIQAEIRHDRKILCTESGHLPRNLEIPQLYKETFSTYYAKWGVRSNWGGGREIVDGDGTIEYHKACIDKAKQLEELFQTWIKFANLGEIYGGIAREIPKGSQPLFILEAPGNPAIQRLPWHSWYWLNKAYPGTEVVISKKAFPVEIAQNRLRILVVLGSEENIDLKADWTALESNLKSITAELQLLKQPSFNDLRDQIRQGCDILFFAGHSDSDSDNKSGSIKINVNEIINISDLIPEIDSAVRKGLKMVFMNSCSGLGIASLLAEHNVPYVVAMREPIHNDVAAKLIESCLASLAEGNSLTSAVSLSRIALKRLENKYICASWMPIIFQSREAADYIPFPQKIEQPQKSFFLSQLITPRLSDRGIKKVPLIILLAVALASALTGYKIWSGGSPEILESIGDQPLFPKMSSTAKTEGINLFANKDYEQAINKFNESLRSQPNDPEARIYLNNSLALHQSAGASLPIIPVISSATSGHSTAIEILRGVAVAQTEINQDIGGIKGKKILLKIVLDNNDPNLAKKVAQKLAQKSVQEDIKAVIGHAYSNSSIVAAPIYERAGIVMVSATSSTMELRGLGRNIFRTVPNSEVMTKTLSEYIFDKAKKKKLGFCFDSKLTAGITFKDAFIANFNRKGGSVVPIKCDASDPNFSPHLIVQDMAKQGADGLMMYYHFNESYQLQAAKDIAQSATNLNLPLFGSASLVASDIAESGHYFQGMVLVTPRHPDSPLARNFSNTFKGVFADPPNWRDMMGYDALKAVVMGLKASDGTSKGLAQKLHDPNFPSIPGSSGPIKFSQGVDRLITPDIAQVQCNIQCKFVWIPDTKTNSKQVNGDPKKFKETSPN
jgi:branched-chain amino acid transport system substrate-binding protein